MPRPAYRPMTIVVAATQRRFRAWCHDNQRNPRDLGILAITSDDDLNKLRALSLSRSNDTIVNLGGGPRHALQTIEMRFRRA